MNNNTFEYVEANRASAITDTWARLENTLTRRINNFLFHEYGEDAVPDAEQAFSLEPPKKILVSRQFEDENGEPYVAPAISIAIGTNPVFYVKLTNDKPETVLSACRDILRNGLSQNREALVAEATRQQQMAKFREHKNAKAVVASNAEASVMVASKTELAQKISKGASTGTLATAGGTS